MVATVRSRTASSESLSQTTGKQMTCDCADIIELFHRTFMRNTHRTLGNNTVEEFLVDYSSISLLFEVETKQDSHLSLIRLIFWIHLKQTQTFLS